MADPVEIIQTALSVAKTIYDIAKSIKDAPSEIKALERGAFQVRSILGKVVEDLEDHRNAKTAIDSRAESLEMSLEEARRLTENVNVFLHKVMEIKPDGSYKLRKVNWILQASNAKALADQMHKFYISVSAVRVMYLPTATQIASVTNSSFERVVQQLEERVAMMTQSLLADQEMRIRAEIQALMLSAAMEQRGGRSQLFDQMSTGSSATLSSWSTQSALSIQCQSSELGATTGQRVLLASSTSTTVPAVRCPVGCLCRCHRPPVSVIPRALSSWFGDLYIPPFLLSVLSSSRTRCDKQSCMRRESDLLAIKYYLPAWCAEIHADIRFKSFPVHFYIRTPRVVESLHWLRSASLEEVQQKLSSHELTVNDVMPDGWTVAHFVMNRMTWDTSEMASSILALLVDHSVPDEWLCKGLTPLESNLRLVQMNWRRYGSREAALGAFRSRIAGTQLYHNIEDAGKDLADKMHWTDLHRWFAAPPSSSRQATDINSISREFLAFQANSRDSVGRTPMYYALSEGPETIELLLQAGADPLLDKGLLWYVAQKDADMLVGLFVRAGAEVNIRDRDGWTVLHWAANPDTWQIPAGLAFAQAIVRHAGHALDWDVQDIYGYVPLHYAELRMDRNSSDEESKRILELYRTHRLPEMAQYIEPDRIVAADEEEDRSELPTTSLIRAGLRGDVEAIGVLIRRDAMVNERDRSGRTLLHLIALGIVPNGYRVALELVRHGGYGVDWEARMYEVGEEHDNDDNVGDKDRGEDQDNKGEEDKGFTALELVARRLAEEELDPEARKETENIYCLLEARRLPPGEQYVFPCMHPDFRTREQQPRQPEARMPGSWIHEQK